MAPSRLPSLLLLFAASWCLAEVKISTQVAPLSGVIAQAGVITMTLDDDDFQVATPANPIYIRITLDHHVTFHDTLVPPSQDHDPLLLPVTLISDNPTDQINVPQDAVSIARWVAGETELWLRIAHPSSTWVMTAAGPTSPSPSHPVSFTFGLAAGTHVASLAGSGQSNLDYARYQSRDRPVSTQLCVDLSQSDLEPLPSIWHRSLLNFDPIALQISKGVETVPTQDEIVTGIAILVFITDHTRIGRRQAADACSLTLPLATPKRVARQKRGQGAALTLNHSFRMDCPGGLQPQTQLTLTLSGQDHGFPVQVGGDHQPVATRDGFSLEEDALTLEPGWSVPIAPQSAVTQVHGVWLADHAQATYQGPGPGERDQHFTTRTRSPSAATPPPRFQLRIQTPDGPPILDRAPYNAPDQLLTCGRESFLLEQTYSVRDDRILITAVTFDDDSGEDTATLKNAGLSPIDLSGWLVLNGFNHGRINGGNQLEAGTRVTLHLNTAGVDTDTDWYLDQPIDLANSGELALFVDESLHPIDSMRAYVQWGLPNQTHAARAATALLWGSAEDVVHTLAADTALTLSANAWPPLSRCDWIPSAAASDYRDALTQWPAVSVLNLVRYECRTDLSARQSPIREAAASIVRRGDR